MYNNRENPLSSNLNYRHGPRIGKESLALFSIVGTRSEQYNITSPPPPKRQLTFIIKTSLPV
jgi:hypothetical protein